MPDALSPLTSRQAKRSVMLVCLLLLIGIPVYGLVAHFITKDIGKPIPTHFTAQQIHMAVFLGSGVVFCLSWGLRWVMIHIAPRYTTPEEYPMALARALILGMMISETPAIFGLVAYLFTANIKMLEFACVIAAVAVLSHLIGIGTLFRQNNVETAT